jgi:type II secretory pathway pseudopilin PulG
VAARGFSVTETLAVMTVGSMLTAVAAPSMDGYLARARTTKAINDTRVIAGALVRLSHDVSAAGSRATAVGDAALLVSEGRVPRLGDGGEAAWIAPRDLEDGGRVERLADHLVTNLAGYAPRAGTPGRTFGGWRGPYLDGGAGADPWGWRYAVNVRWLSRRVPFDTLVLSPGPDGAVQTAFGRDGLATGGDDLSALVSSGT